MSRLVRAALTLVLAAGCDRGNKQIHEPTDAAPPTAEVYPEGPSNFAGEWVGESAGVFGTLAIERLEGDRYAAQFVGDDGLTRFTCEMRQMLATPPNGGEVSPSNLAVFTWYDGRGGRGSGWVLINREDSALSGEIRFSGPGAWDFVRVDEADASVQVQLPAS